MRKISLWIERDQTFDLIATFEAREREDGEIHRVLTYEEFTLLSELCREVGSGRKELRQDSGD